MAWAGIARDAIATEAIETRTRMVLRPIVGLLTL